MKTKNIVILSFILLLFPSCKHTEQMGMREAFADKFLIGAAINERQIYSKDEKLHTLIKKEFSSLVAENCMKMESLQLEEGRFNFTTADKLVELAESNGQTLIGHCLVWHSQAPKWFFHDKDGKEVSRDVLIERLKNHIQGVVGHFKGRVKGWDVVNEAIMEDGNLRHSYYYKIIGPEFIRMAFEFAHEADPQAELYYNDYNMHFAGKREGVIRLIRELKSKGIRIDGIGMQSHVAFNTPLDEYEKSIIAFANEGVKVMITELDLSVLPWPHGNFGAAVETDFEYEERMNPYKNGLTPEAIEKQTRFYTDLFKIYLRHADHISRVTFWGVSDGDSWKNNWPMHGRTDYPLAFDRNYNAKPFVKNIIRLSRNK